MQSVMSQLIPLQIFCPAPIGGLRRLHAETEQPLSEPGSGESPGLDQNLLSVNDSCASRVYNYEIQPDATLKQKQRHVAP